MEPFIGEIRIFGFNFVPYGWALCNGAQMVIAQNTALYAVIGVTYGGDGKTYFNLPNLLGRVPMHFGQGAGLSSHELGSTGGGPSVQLTADYLPPHNHALLARNSPGNSANPGGTCIAVSPLRYQPAATGLVDMASAAVAAAGFNGAHNNMMPYLSLNFCIAIQGVFPARS